MSVVRDRGHTWELDKRGRKNTSVWNLRLVRKLSWKTYWNIEQSHHLIVLARDTDDFMSQDERQYKRAEWIAVLYCLSFSVLEIKLLVVSLSTSCKENTTSPHKMNVTWPIVSSVCFDKEQSAFPQQPWWLHSFRRVWMVQWLCFQEGVREADASSSLWYPPQDFTSRQLPELSNNNSNRTGTGPLHKSIIYKGHFEQRKPLRNQYSPCSFSTVEWNYAADMCTETEILICRGHGRA